jgi:hypothetical protein
MVTLPPVSGKSCAGSSSSCQSIEPVGVFETRLETLTPIEDCVPATQEAMMTEETSDAVWLMPLMYKSESTRPTTVVAVAAGPDVVVGATVGGGDSARTAVDPVGVSVVVVGRCVAGVATL